ncbi:NUDIX hydrolase [Rhizobium grahamii]|uniref:MutT/NUDIX family NTP pyrophosphohydrolase n=1 Tax=Rhizobium grahamii CCGE 502 TaxID=990285 RepID=S3IBN2_9HYPH|nr:NUDIX hydrolase [Rhizobium grahamii]EPE96633.1 MutT/NUDIX family NTP pyrophosphohydrolase [Rhizobium grahamii CCGE 502]
MADFTETLLYGEAAKQMGAICYRRGDSGVEVLLITTRETGRWTIPKGWPIRGLKSHKAAEQEAWEEAGVKGRARRKVFGKFTYVKTLVTGVNVRATVDVHLLDVRRTRSRFPERGQRKLKWFRPLDAASRVDETELKILLSKVAKRFS